MQKPLFTSEEFIRSQDLEQRNEKCLEVFCPLSDLEKTINTCITDPVKHAAKIFSLQCGPGYLEEHLTVLEQSNRQTLTQENFVSGLNKVQAKVYANKFSADLVLQRKDIAAEQIGAEKVLTLASEMRKTKVARYIFEESKGRNVESCNYPGFKVKQLSKLPRHLEAPKLWDLYKL